VLALWYAFKKRSLVMRSSLPISRLLSAFDDRVSACGER